MAHRLLSTVSLICLLSASAMAAEPLSTRAEVSFKGGNKRSILTTEIWAPLAQKNDQVLYGDIRLMGDNDENREGNLGIGYREINPHTNSVVGVHGWIDRRRTQNNSTFHQLTFGVESLGHVWDMRLNGYVPLNKGRALAGETATNPYLANTGIFYDVNGFPIETPQYGTDAELGYRLPILQRQADAIRIYGGGYHFFRNGTENVTGFRLRTEAQINSAFSIGARFQHDNPRGSQGFLEATIKFPFGAKKLYQTDGLRARLDESPERDVDIVTANVVTPGRTLVPVLNVQSGTEQRVLHVDNSKTQSGDGSINNPFNTLAAAQAVMRDNDVIYVNYGNGTTSGMDSGITINKANVSVIGSGVNFVWDNGKYTSSYDIAPKTGTIIKAASFAPVITNSAAYVNNGLNGSVTGNGIYLTDAADNTSIAGVNIANTAGDGIYLLANGASSVVNGLTVSHVNFTNNRSGIRLHAENGGAINNISLNNVNVDQSAEQGIFIYINNGSSNAINLSNITSSNNDDAGLRIIIQRSTVGNISLNKINTNQNGYYAGSSIASYNATVGNIDITDLTSDGNQGYGLEVYSSQSAVNDITLTNISTNNNANNGLYMQNSAGTNGKVTVQKVKTHGNQYAGVYLFRGGEDNDIMLSHIDATSNSGSGINIQSSGSNALKRLTITDSVTNNNTSGGLYLSINSSANGIYLNNITTEDNASNGVAAFFSSGTINEVQLNNVAARGNNEDGIKITLSSTVNNFGLSHISASQNTMNGVNFFGGGATIGTMSIDNIDAHQNTMDGFYFYGGGTRVTNFQAHNLNLSQNTMNGFHFYGGGSTINSMAFDHLNADRNGMNGFMMDAGGTTLSATFSNSSFTNNTLSGLYLNTSSLMGNNITVDLGSSAANTGHNRLFGNNAAAAANEGDLRLNLNGGNISAVNNWWGQAGGPNAGQIVNKGSGPETGTADTSGALSSDPQGNTSEL